MMQPGTWSPGKTLEDCERESVMACLRFFEGNKQNTANSLGVSLKTLYNKIQKYIETGHLPKGSYGAPERIEAGGGDGQGLGSVGGDHKEDIPGSNIQTPGKRIRAKDEAKA